MMKHFFLPLVTLMTLACNSGVDKNDSTDPNSATGDRENHSTGNNGMGSADSLQSTGRSKAMYSDSASNGRSERPD